MRIFPGNALSCSIASLAVVTLLLGSTALPLPALAFSQLNPPASQAKDAAQSTQQKNGKPIEQALEAPTNNNALPTPEPLINKQASQSSGDASSANKSVEFLYDIDKAPEPVKKLRTAIVEAAASGDLERLRPLMNVGGGLKQTQVTADDPGEDPIKTLHDLSGDPDGIEILSILLDIMSTGFAHVGQGTPDEVYVWPYFAQKDIKTLSTPEKVDLMRIVTAGDYADMLEFGGYNFYRVGITPDGRWKFFTSGE
ncbi:MULTISPECIES: hypothetical protein [unclassified Rhizobium]|uniref:hypothetical protein n=1 Tax=unclassified Rhizobium TaxID=2613769 RepID=UPI000DDD2AE2|nr:MULTISPECIES: hypothetical protein [unclassified Rhizobium]MBB3288226.1 hypothetical protein [Rhizobium sp. BK252]MBB3402910.1 hypothetical protein [Rhizobium sp. BK289]MBB3415487.1 hypothetical protein [Rhizobium sp. BK284]MBB3483432.1 hypothetical protein [Rhizobium sp. BK347]MDK4723456.1 hypothetical protein [Rhizobium sp. CNPSo 3968]